MNDIKTEFNAKIKMKNSFNFKILNDLLSLYQLRFTNF